MPLSRSSQALREPKPPLRNGNSALLGQDAIAHSEGCLYHLRLAKPAPEAAGPRDAPVSPAAGGPRYVDLGRSCLTKTPVERAS